VSVLHVHVLSITERLEVAYDSSFKHRRATVSNKGVRTGSGHRFLDGLFSDAAHLLSNIWSTEGLHFSTFAQAVMDLEFLRVAHS